MEKGIKRIERKAFLSFFISFFMISSLFSQMPSFKEKIRIPLWSDLEAYPEIAGQVEKAIEESEDPVTQKNGLYDYPIKQIKKVAPFLISGMVYGWEFVYVPSDKARGVEEYFEITEIHRVSERDIVYSEPMISNNSFYVWCTYERNKEQIRNYSLWASIVHPVISGRGFGSVEKGFEGIKLAAEDALKTAVREHYRGKVKNKPKEITGSVLIRSEPLLGIDAGRYAIDLDFFLEYGNIIEYTVY